MATIPPAAPPTQSPTRTIEKAIDRLRAMLAHLDELDRASAQETAAADSANGSEPMPRAAGQADALMDWLRADLSGRYFGVEALRHVAMAPLEAIEPRTAPIAVPEAGAGDVALAGSIPAWPVIDRKDRYVLHELMGLHDEAFVHNAYVALMRRDPDPEGFEHFRRVLRSGQLSRLEVLIELRYSDEGRAAGVPIRGMRRVRLFQGAQRIPVLGPFIGIVGHLLHLPSIVRNLDRLDAAVARHHWDLASRIEDLATSVEGAIVAAERRQAEAIAALGRGIRALDEAERATRLQAGALTERVGALQASDAALRKWAGAFGENLVSLHMLTTKLKEANAQQATRTQLNEVARAVLDSVASLEGMAAEFEARKGTLALIDAGTKHALLQLDAVKSAQQKTERRLDKIKVRRSNVETQGDQAFGHSLDAFYADFEDRFRGTREDIKSRVETYVPLVEEAYRATGEAPVLDVGCGRGEWLEAMRERGIAAKGVDSNDAMIARCREMGLDVVESGGVEHISTLKANTLTAVTGFHVIEHMPFGDIVALFQETFRVLKPGGVVIFESPNPENILVGSCNFWYDPTHVKPLPPKTVQHLAEASGFERAEIKRLHPFPEWELIPEGSDEPLRTRLNALLYGPQDYSIIAYKP